MIDKYSDGITPLIAGGRLPEVEMGKRALVYYVNNDTPDFNLNDSFFTINCYAQDTNDNQPNADRNSYLIAQKVVKELKGLQTTAGGYPVTVSARIIATIPDPSIKESNTAVEVRTEILPETMMKGSFKVEYAPIVADHTLAVWVDVGMADDCSFVEEATFLEGSPSNGTKPAINTGVAEQKVNIAFSPWSLDPTNYMALRGAIDTLETDVDGNRSIYTGGLTNITELMMRFTNRRDDVATAADVIQYPNELLVAGDPIYRDTYFTSFKCSMTAGASITGKRDDDTDAAIRFPFAMQGIQDTDRDAGKQLFVIEYKVTKIV
jgi:hypothetical protein